MPPVRTPPWRLQQLSVESLSRRRLIATNGNVVIRNKSRCRRDVRSGCWVGTEFSDPEPSERRWVDPVQFLGWWQPRPGAQYWFAGDEVESRQNYGEEKQESGCKTDGCALKIVHEFSGLGQSGRGHRCVPAMIAVGCMDPGWLLLPCRRLPLLADVLVDVERL